MRTVNPAQYAHQRARILDTACALFARYGYDRTSMDRIATACRVQKPSLYHYFKSKQALLRELIRTRLRETHSGLHHRPVPPTIELRLSRIAQTFLAGLEQRRNLDFMRLLFGDASNHTYIRRVYNGVVSELSQDLSNSGRMAGLVGAHPALPGMAMHQFMGSLLRYAVERRLWRSGAGARYPERAYVAQLSKIFACGLKGTTL
jgi:AcrR family transcriptional regulator